VPAISTIWRILKRRGFVTPQPHKRPRSSWKRFCAELPNPCWQADVTHWHLDAAGVITLRYSSRLHHIGLGKRRTGTKVTVLIDDRDIRVLDRHTGQLIRKLVLDPTRDYQPRGVKCGNSPETGNGCKPCLGTPVNDVPRHDTSRADRI
jgi:hypothetical protein